MVKGIEIFRDRFRSFERSFILIGGAACDEWFTRQGLAFRATKDLDIVLLIEVLDREFVAAMRAFVEEGGYEIRQRAKGSPVLYRFAKPRDDRFPAMIELFSRNPENFDLADGQFIIPVQVEPDQHSLSAILLDEACRGEQRRLRAGKLETAQPLLLALLRRSISPGGFHKQVTFS